MREKSLYGMGSMGGTDMGDDICPHPPLQNGWGIETNDGTKITENSFVAQMKRPSKF